MTHAHLIANGKKAAMYILFGFTVLFPIFFLPTSVDFFDWNKIVLTFAVAALLLILWTAISVIRKTVRLTFSPLAVPMLLFSFAWVLSAVFAAINKGEAFTGFTLLVLSSFAIFVLGSHLLKTKTYEVPMVLLGVSGSILTLVSLLQVLGIGPSSLLNSVFGLQLPNTIEFSLAGSPFNAVLFLVPVLAGTVAMVLSTSGLEKKATYAVIAGILLAGVLLNGFFLLPGKSSQLLLLPPSTSWAISLEVLKSPKTALLGVGPESYVYAFSQFRPVAYNLLPQWGIRYNAATNVPLHLLTTLGVLGLLAYGYFVIRTVRTVFPLKKETLPLGVAVLSVLAMQLFLPFSVGQIVLLFIVLMFAAAIMKNTGNDTVTDVTIHLFAVRLVSPEREQKSAPENATVVLTYIVSGVVFLLVAASTYVVGKAYASGYLFYQSILAAQKNDGSTTYNLQAQAVQLNPTNMQLRRAFATTNFALARSISENENPSDEDKANISTLVQQAISEAKAAITLDPRMPANWETLSFLYKNLIGTAQDADQWTIASYVQAIQTDPVNPSLRIDLGGVYLTLEKYDEAIQLFQQTINLKPNWANAYYNLGYAYAQKKDSQNALAAYTQALQLLDPQSPDRAKLQEEVDTLQEAVDKAAQAGTGTQGSAEEQENTEGQIRIPENLGLPAAEPPANVPTPEPEFAPPEASSEPTP